MNLKIHLKALAVVITVLGAISAMVLIILLFAKWLGDLTFLVFIAVSFSTGIYCLAYQGFKDQS